MVNVPQHFLSLFSFWKTLFALACNGFCPSISGISVTATKFFPDVAPNRYLNFGLTLDSR
jgi:hypothetical protein